MLDLVSRFPALTAIFSAHDAVARLKRVEQDFAAQVLSPDTRELIKDRLFRLTAHLQAGKSVSTAKAIVRNLEFASSTAVGNKSPISNLIELCRYVA